MAWPDVEGAVVARLKAYTPVTALISTRTFYGHPKAATAASYPFAVVTRPSGGPSSFTSQAPVDEAGIQVDAWGELYANGNGNKAGLWPVVSAIRDALDIERPLDLTTPSGTVRVLGSIVESVIWLPDQDDDRPRYVILAQVTALSV